MSTKVSDIRQGLVSSITTAFPDVQCTGYVLEAPTPPFVDIEIHANGIDYDLAAARGLDHWTFTVRLCVPRTSDIGSQVSLDNYLVSSGTGSMKAAIESDDTLGGIVEALHVSHATGPRAIGVASHSAPGNVYHGAEWLVEVWARGK